jgi:hypothetical protein
MGGTGINKMLRRTNALPIQHKVKNYRCPAIPARTEHPIMGLKSNKDFIIANAVENILQRIFNTVDINFLAAKTIPIKRRYINKKNYGVVPKYLKEIK